MFFSYIFLQIQKMENLEGKFEQNPSLKTRKIFNGVQILMRIMVIVTTLVASLLMFTSKQITYVFGISFEARYNYSPAFKFFAYANGVACGLSITPLFLSFIITHQTFNPLIHFLLFLHDLLVMSLVLAACAAASAIGYVGRYGNSHAGWMAICHDVRKFCDRVMTALIFSYFSFFFLLALTVVSARKSSFVRL